MDLLSKAIVIAVVAVIIVVGIYYAFQKVFLTGQVSEPQAVSLVTNYLESHNPGAVINITNVTPSQYQGSWHIEATFIGNASSPCPEYVLYSFDYPKYGFVNRTDNIYTKGCVIYGLVGNSNYSIGAYPIAISRATSLNITPVEEFILKYGYGNVTARALYYQNVSMFNGTYSKIWIVNYSSVNANSSVHAVISQTDGKYLFSYNQTK